MLDLRNKKLLAELEMNARMPYSELAKKLKISKQAVKSRITQLEKEQIIQGYNAVIDLTKLGKTIYVIYLQLIRIFSKEEQIWFSELEKNKNVIAVGKNAGYWDMTLVLEASNLNELDLRLKSILKNKTDKIKSKIITSEIESTYFNLNMIEKTKSQEISTSAKQENLILDEKDEKLINYLSKDCRISLLNLSQKIGMSPNGVKHKIKLLENKKIIIGYKTKINYEKLGFLHFRVFLNLKTMDTQNYNLIKQFLKSNGNVESISRYVGYADIDFRCYVKTIFELYSLISQIKDKFLQNIIEINSMPIFSWNKIEFVK